MRQPLNPKVSGASPTSASLPQAMIVISAFLAFMLVLFSDFIATAFGGYAAIDRGQAPPRMRIMDRHQADHGQAS